MSGQLKGGEIDRRLAQREQHRVRAGALPRASCVGNRMAGCATAEEDAFVDLYFCQDWAYWFAFLWALDDATGYFTYLTLVIVSARQPASRAVKGCARKGLRVSDQENLGKP